MTQDPRTTPANGHAAASELRGKVEAARYVKGTMKTVRQPLANLLDKPRGERTSQLLYGETFRVIDEREGYSFGQGLRDGYCGWVATTALARHEEATHWIAAPATHLYVKPSLRAQPEVSLYCGSRVRVVSEQGDFCKLSTGHHAPVQHLRLLRQTYMDAVRLADLFLGTPYLWGGVSPWGVDCSGLVQRALLGAGHECPRDSDQQMAELGRPLLGGEDLKRGDLIFWKGHVGILASPTRLLHANAYTMSVAYENLGEAIERIARSSGPGQGSGEVLAIKRLERL
ncbi:C40 family peptidase [Jannaschia aquimarina]|uniref:YkfC protein n=1 Tax=Jannaschia aquimarina TaxID=935700 RepID=A0A0D1DAN0_9RHOB|nr:C40 family peptidase [Jannaschia aquimarina]KIT16993.1 Gamma-D-glutamyl-L-lysine endopeptidase [Jannaschia aquimarina]SNS81029.1 NlpC/P60 family protein [Jannaschia aquimarina]